MTYQDLYEALMAFYGDTSRSREETADGLETIIEEAQLLLETFE